MSLESTWKKVTNAIDELLTLKIKTVVTDPEQGNRVMSTKLDWNSTQTCHMIITSLTHHVV